MVLVLVVRAAAGATAFVLVMLGAVGATAFVVVVRAAVGATAWRVPVRRFNASATAGNASPITATASPPSSLRFAIVAPR